MRPVYETPEDLKRQEAVARVFENEWKCKLVRNKALDPIDYNVVRNDTQVVAFAEVKCRAVESSRYDSIILSLRKAVTGVMQSELTGKPFMLLVGFEDCYAHVPIKRDHLSRIKIAGRTDRGDPDDMEACIEIPSDHFKLFGHV